MEYIKSEDLIEEVYNEGLEKYRKANQIDDSIFYSKIDAAVYGLNQSKIIKCVSIKIIAGSGELPKDYQKSKLIYRYRSHEITLQNGGHHSHTINVCEPRKCYDEPNVRCDGSMYYIDHYFQGFRVKYEIIEELKESQCKESSIKLEEGKIIVPFFDGDIYLLYYSNESENQIPSNPKIKEAIKTLLLYHGFRHLLLKGVQDVTQRVQFLEREAAIAQNILQTYKDKISFNQMNELKNMKISIYNAQKRIR
jgi:hypothetical protein